MSHFAGIIFEEERDGERLARQLAKVQALMSDGGWRTLSEIEERIPEASQAGISARLRDLRKPKFGGHTVDRRYVGRGLWEYRLTLRTE